LWLYTIFLDTARLRPMISSATEFEFAVGVLVTLMPLFYIIKVDAINTNPVFSNDF